LFFSSFPDFLHLFTEQRLSYDNLNKSSTQDLSKLKASKEKTAGILRKAKSTGQSMVQTLTSFDTRNQKVKPTEKLAGLR
jgi:hypothetical protein